MFDWLRRRRFHKKRQIFRYFDGRHARAIDPLKAIHDLDNHPVFRADVHLAQVDRGESEGQRIAAEAACDVFELREFRDEPVMMGLTMGEQLEVLRSFFLYLADLKKNTSETATSQLPTEPMSSKSVSTTTNDTSDSGPTDLEPSVEKPIASLEPSTPP